MSIATFIIILAVVVCAALTLLLGLYLLLSAAIWLERKTEQTNTFIEVRL